MNLGVELLVIVVLTLVNGFFSAAEIGVLSVRRTRLQELADSGKGAARAALRLRDDPEQFLATVQVGITVVGATAAAFGGATLAKPLAAWLSSLGIERGVDTVALGLVVSLISVLTIVLGELVPKSIALRASERVSLLVARPLSTLSRAARPLVWLLTKLSNVILKPFQDEATFLESRISPEELQTMVEEAATAGALSPGIGDIASRAIELGQLPITSLMIPRRQVVSLPIGGSQEEIWSVLKQHPHARYPVVESTLDTPQGYVTVRDLVTQFVETGSVDVRAALRELPAFTERALAVEVLRALQQKRSPLAVVVDEHAMISGIVTITDIAEELLGDFLDEYERPATAIRREAPGVAVIRADTPIQDINRALDVSLAVSPDYATLSGLLMECSNKILKAGEHLTVGDVRFEVLEATPRQVKLVRMRFAPPGTQEGDT